MNITHLYFMPGLAASSRIFESISLPRDRFGIHLLEWLPPLSVEETIENYAKRMSLQIKHENVVIVGVSFGGYIAQEISKIKKVSKVILVSSIKSNQEMSTFFKLLKKTKLYKLAPAKIIKNIEYYEFLFFNKYLKKQLQLYKLYLPVRDIVYLRWSIHNVINWKQKDVLDNVIHIHGSDDEVFPSKNITNFISIKGGTHVMILTRAKQISEIIQKECNSLLINHD